MCNRYNSNQSIWEDALYNQKYDFVVIGAGLTGLATAYFAKKKYPNSRILILERGIFPIGASTRNAGFACIGSIAEHLSDLEVETESNVKARIKARYNGLQLLKSTLGEDAMEYNACGGWELFTDDAEFQKAQTNIHRWNDWMNEMFQENEVYKSGEFQGYPAIFNRLEGSLHPRKMIKLNIQLGNEIRWQSEVASVQPDSGVVQTKTGQVLNSDKVVLATNAFTSTFSSSTKISPARGYVFITKAIPNFQWNETFHFNKGYMYFRNLGTDRLLIGGGRNVDYDAEAIHQFGINKTIREYLIDFVHTVIKLPAHWEIEREWSGIMGFTETKSPSIEKIGSKTWQVAGLSGMGIALGMALGKKAAERL